MTGQPVVGEEQVVEAGRLPVGAWLQTDPASRASVAIADIGRLDVDPGTRLQLLGTREGNHRVALQRGTVHALIWAPPGEFVVETEASTAIDLGCAYTLTVAPGGNGMIEVSMGWVGFEHGGREAFIPAGARCATRPGVGPGHAVLCGHRRADAAGDRACSTSAALDIGGAARGRRLRSHRRRAAAATR